MLHLPLVFVVIIGLKVTKSCGLLLLPSLVKSSGVFLETEHERSLLIYWSWIFQFKKYFWYLCDCLMGFFNFVRSLHHILKCNHSCSSSSSKWWCNFSSSSSNRLLCRLCLNKWCTLNPSSLARPNLSPSQCSRFLKSLCTFTLFMKTIA